MQTSWSGAFGNKFKVLRDAREAVVKSPIVVETNLTVLFCWRLKITNELPLRLWAGLNHEKV